MEILLILVSFTILALIFDFKMRHYIAFLLIIFTHSMILSICYDYTDQQIIKFKNSIEKKPIKKIKKKAIYINLNGHIYKQIK